MPNGRPGDSRSHDILHHRLTVFGPPIDALVREIDARIEPAERGAFIELIETWPWNDDGSPRQPDALVHRLSAMRDRLGPKPRLAWPDDPPAPQASFSPRRRGSVLAALIGVVIGGFVGLPLGFLAYAVGRETGALPVALWPSDAAIWGIVGVVAAGCALLGALQGGLPTRLGHTLLIAVLGCFVGSLVFGLAAAVLALVIGALGGASQREGGFAMGVVFGLVPLAAALGGVLGALWTGRRAWKEWRG